MTKFDNRFDSARQDWETPQSFFEQVDSIYHFDIDLAANAENTKCQNYFTIEDNALLQEWRGTCWLNPPYHGGKENALMRWVQKAYKESCKPNCTVVMLIPARTSTKWWADYCMKAKTIRFVIGRIAFVGAKYGLPVPLVLVEFAGEGYNANFTTISAS